MPYSKLLKNLTKIYSFTQEQEEAIANCIIVRKFKKRDKFFEIGEVNRQIGFINKGLFKTYITDQEGIKHNISFACEDFWITDLNSYVTSQGSLSAIECVEDAELFCFHYDDMEELYKKIPKLESHFRIMSQNRMVALYKDRFNLISLSAEERYIKFLNEFPIFVQRISQKDIASYLGIFPETLSRIRRNIAIR